MRIGSVLCAAMLVVVPAARAQAQTTFTVNSSSDLVDMAPNDGACDAGGGQCTLRAAVMEANALAGDDTILFDPGLNGTPITLSIAPVDECPPLGCFNDFDDAVGDIDIVENLTIAGNGAGNTILQGGPSLAGSVARVFEVISTSCLRCITTSISGVTIRYGGGAEAQGGMAINGGAVLTTITDSVISENDGSGISFNYAGRLLIDRVTFAGNRAPKGGGLQFGGSTATLVVSNSTFSGNTADDGAGGGRGGAVYIDSSTNADPAPSIVNSTLSGNLAVEGCAIFNADGPLALHDVTVANNCAAGSGQPALVSFADDEGEATVFLRNSVVTSPPGVVNCRSTISPWGPGIFVSEGYNVANDSSCPLAAAGDLQNTDPLLGPLANNGGPTLTHLLLPGSPAIDTGSPVLCPATDQRGLARPVDGNLDGVARCDRGAVEVAASAPPPSTGAIEGTAWNDTSPEDGARQPGEPGYPGLQICLFPTTPTLCTTTLFDGTYQFSGLAPGSYHVYERLPASRLSTTPRSRQVTAVAGGVVADVDFGSRVPPPPPPGWNTPVVTESVKGNYFVLKATPPCAANSVSVTAFYAGGVTETTPMFRIGATNDWEVALPITGGVGSVLPYQVEADCTSSVFFGYLVFVDPSGTIIDGCTNQPLAGATVTLLKNDPYGSSTYVVPDPAEHIPSFNPEVTAADGFYGWDVVPGRWSVRASKPGYETVTTDPFDVPPPKLGLDITLMPTAACNAPPVAKDDTYGADQASLTVGAPGVLGNDSDPDGNALTAMLVTDAANGHVVLAGNGSFTYTPNAGFSGTDTFTYKASDGTADSNVATVTIAVRMVNRPPVARDDAYRTKKNRAFFIGAPGVLANDADPEGSALSAALVRRPARGFVVLFPNGALVYLPKPGFVGTDSFTYTADDGVSRSEATVTITVAGKKPHDRDEDDDDDHRRRR